MNPKMKSCKSFVNLSNLELLILFLIITMIRKVFRRWNLSRMFWVASACTTNFISSISLNRILILFDVTYSDQRIGPKKSMTNGKFWRKICQVKYIFLSPPLNRGCYVLLSWRNHLLTSYRPILYHCLWWNMAFNPNDNLVSFSISFAGICISQIYFLFTEKIFVRVCETRMELMRAVIIGPQGTPYHDGLFFFDCIFPPNYPTVPPVCIIYGFCVVGCTFVACIM